MFGYSYNIHKTTGNSNKPTWNLTLNLPTISCFNNNRDEMGDLPNGLFKVFAEMQGLFADYYLPFAD